MPPNEEVTKSSIHDQKSRKQVFKDNGTDQANLILANVNPLKQTICKEIMKSCRILKGFCKPEPEMI